MDVVFPSLFDDVPVGAGEDSESVADEIMTINHNETCEKATQVTSGDLILCRSFLKNMTPSGLKTLTGLQSFSLLECLIEMLKNDFGKSLKVHQMPLKDQIILTLMRLKVNLTFAALSVLFECSGTTCKSIFEDVIQHLSCHLKDVIQWLPKEIIMNNMPQVFRNIKIQELF